MLIRLLQHDFRSLERLEPCRLCWLPRLDHQQGGCRVAPVKILTSSGVDKPQGGIGRFATSSRLPPENLKDSSGISFGNQASFASRTQVARGRDACACLCGSFLVVVATQTFKATSGPPCHAHTWEYIIPKCSFHHTDHNFKENSMKDLALSRTKLIELAMEIQDAQDQGKDCSILLSRLQSQVAYPKVEELFVGDYSADYIVDFSLSWRSEWPRISKQEMIALVEKLMEGNGTQVELALMTLLFDANCIHFAKNGLLYYPEEYFEGNPDPSASEIVEKALTEG